MITLNNFVDGSVAVLLYSLTQMDEKVKTIIRVFLRQEEENRQQDMPGFQVKFRLEAPHRKYCY
jgi:hypothetical protein